MALKKTTAAPDVSPKPGVLSKAAKKNLGLLQDAGVSLDGSETEADLEQLVADNNLGEQDATPEVIDGVPNKVEIQHAIEISNGKEVKVPIWHMLPVKDGFAVYDHAGRRVSPLLVPGNKLGGEENGIDEVAHHRKVIARNNVLRRARRLPNDPA